MNFAELTTVFVFIFGTCCGDSCIDDKWINCPKKAAENPSYNCGKWGYKQLCCASCKNVKMDPECPDGEQWSCRKGAQEEPAYYCRPDNKKNCCVSCKNVTMDPECPEGDDERCRQVRKFPNSCATSWKKKNCCGCKGKTVDLTTSMTCPINTDGDECQKRKNSWGFCYESNRDICPSTYAEKCPCVDHPEDCKDVKDNPVYWCGIREKRKKCCATCKYVKTDPECPYGEYARCRKDARDYPAHYCSPYGREKCCISCKNVTMDPECPEGDGRVGGDEQCRPFVQRYPNSCASPSVKKDCCWSCKGKGEVGLTCSTNTDGDGCKALVKEFESFTTVTFCTSSYTQERCPCTYAKMCRGGNQ